MKKKNSNIHTDLVFDRNIQLLVPIDLIDQIKKEIDEGNYSCGIFVEFQKVFVTVDHY